MDEAEGSYNKQHKPHGMSYYDMIEVMKKLDNPSYIVWQPKQQRYAAVVRIRTKKGGNAIWTSVALEQDISPALLNGYNGGTYNVLVTTFSPSNLQTYLHSEGKEIIYDITKDAVRSESDRVWSSYSNATPFAESSISRDVPDVKGNPDDSVDWSGNSGTLLSPVEEEDGVDWAGSEEEDEGPPHPSASQTPSLEDASYSGAAGATAMKSSTGHRPVESPQGGGSGAAETASQSGQAMLVPTGSEDADATTDATENAVGLAREKTAS